MSATDVLTTASDTFASSIVVPTLTTDATSISSVSPVPPTTGGGNGGSNGGNGIASSAALYLYTFLATLVLLLSVSAAIVTRSFVLRRRHRRMVEEAIRNGTWVPPADPAPGGRTPRVDLSKKPVMWEAHVGGNGGFYGWEKSGGETAVYHHDHQRQSSSGWEGDVKDWDSIKPLSAAYLASEATTMGVAGNKPAPLNLPSAVTDGNSGAGGDDNNVRAPFIRRVGDGFRHVFRATPSSTSPLPNSTSGTQNTAGGVIPANGAASAEDGELNSGSTTIRVAVLIAMPRQHRQPASREISSSGSSFAGPSMSFSPTENHPLSAALTPPPHQQQEEEEGPLPVLEVGVAEVTVVHPETEGDGRERGGRGGGKDVYGRDSASMSVEV